MAAAWQIASASGHSGRQACEDQEEMAEFLPPPGGLLLQFYD